MNKFIVVFYFTNDPIYSSCAKRLISSLQKFEIPYFYKEIESKGNWQKNTQYKPTFLLSMLKKYPDRNVVYVDADAEFRSFPNLFNSLPTDKVGVHVLDHKKHTNRNRPSELLSGTLFLPNTKETEDILNIWAKSCQRNPTIWDQRILQQVIGQKYEYLPESYCHIFDYPYANTVEPVIVHYQASRIVRKKERDGTKNNVPKL